MTQASQKRSASMSPTSRTKTRTPIGRTRVVQVAIDLMQHDGLDALSMRVLADEFGIQAASLYWYVPNKAALLDLMAEELVARMVDNIERRAPNNLGQVLMLYREFLLLNGHSVQLLTSRTVIGEPYVKLLRLLMDQMPATWSYDSMVRCCHALIAFTHGWVLRDQMRVAVHTTGLELTRVASNIEQAAMLSTMTDMPEEHWLSSTDGANFAQALATVMAGFMR